MMRLEYKSSERKTHWGQGSSAFGQTYSVIYANRCSHVKYDHFEQTQRATQSPR